MKVMMTGGGTLGPVTPLLAVVEAWRRRDPGMEFVWVGTTTGPEKAIVEQNTIRFYGITSPKLDRHAPLRWALIPFGLLWSIGKALSLVRYERPDVIVTAGGYVSVPIFWAAKFLSVPTWVHQQDVCAGLANRVMAKTATNISTAWVKTLSVFPESKTVQLGNPVRASVLHGSRVLAGERFGLDARRPTLLVLGGGTGSSWINQAVASIAPDLVSEVNILHVTGREKTVVSSDPRYAVVDLVTTGMADVLALADVVVCRAGMGTISELSTLSKPAVMIPMPDSHQEDNTNALGELRAAIVLDQHNTTPQVLSETIKKLFGDPEECAKLGARLHVALPTEGVAEKLALLIQSIAKKGNT